MRLNRLLGTKAEPTSCIDSNGTPYFSAVVSILTDLGPGLRRVSTATVTHASHSYISPSLDHPGALDRVGHMQLMDECLD